MKQHHDTSENMAGPCEAEAGLHYHEVHTSKQLIVNTNWSSQAEDTEYIHCVQAFANGLRNTTHLFDKLFSFYSTDYNHISMAGGQKTN